jgi:hypothetical protein
MLLDRRCGSVLDLGSLSGLNARFILTLDRTLLNADFRPRQRTCLNYKRSLRRGIGYSTEKLGL